MYRVAVKEYRPWVRRSGADSLVWGYPPFLGRRAYGHSGVARETRERRAGWVPERGRILGPVGAEEFPGAE